MYYLYCIKPNPKEIVYIGFTTDIKRRRKEHQKNFPMYQFEIIATSYSEFWIRKLEELLIKNYKSFVENKQHNYLNPNEFTDQMEGGEWINK